MWPYWLMLFLPVMGALFPRRLPQRQSTVMWCGVGCILIVLIGLRNEVGDDWYAYLFHFYRVEALPFSAVLFSGADPGYYGIGWIISYFGGSIYLLNLVCAAILVIGTIRFSRSQPWPWLSLVAATPYLLIVVGMGYTRQSAAIGLAMLGLVSLGNGKVRRFVFWVLIGATFHKSAILLLPIAALATTKRRLWTWFWVGVISVLGAWLLAFDSSDDLWRNYVVSDYADASQGAPIRVAMNSVAALLFILFQGRMNFSYRERKLWLWMAVWALACAPLLMLSATAVDRIALYFIPLQLVVFARLMMVASSSTVRTSIAIASISYFVAVQFVWLFFASHAHAWVPYQIAWL